MTFLETDDGRSFPQSEDDMLQIKSKLVDLIRMNEVLKSELRRRQRRLMMLVQDKYFLCERLLAHENIPKDYGRPSAAAKRKSEDQDEATPKGRRRYRRRWTGNENRSVADDGGSTSTTTATSFPASSSTALPPKRKRERLSKVRAPDHLIKFSPGFKRMKSLAGTKRNSGPKNKSRVSNAVESSEVSMSSKTATDDEAELTIDE